ncbi:DUF5642 family protein [uncultured Tessaracoccus sp.]|uniref:DUF5642 family protein n=1 Tax=uncultured Tessaracoccus sp. TaxID=905023 RepID=UPI00263808D8|nr:DUF5642 family protein [uncultured Tessaracoccus sp.]
MKLKLAGAAFVALALGLAGCGNDDSAKPESSEPAASATEQAPSDQPEEEEPSTPEQSEDSTSGGEESPAQSPEPTAPALDDAGRAIIDDFLAKHKDAEEIPAEMFDPEQAKTMLSQLKVEPAECNTVLGAQQNPELLNNAVWGGAATVDTSSGSSTSIAVAQFGQEAGPLVEDARTMSEKCPQITIGEGEQTFPATIKVHDAPSVQGADVAHIIENVVDLGGVKQVSFNGQAARGNLFINVALTGAEGSATPGDAEKLLTEAVAAAQ